MNRHQNILLKTNDIILISSYKKKLFFIIHKVKLCNKFGVINQQHNKTVNEIKTSFLNLDKIFENSTIDITIIIKIIYPQKYYHFLNMS